VTLKLNRGRPDVVFCELATTEIRDAIKPIQARGFVLVDGVSVENGSGWRVCDLNFAKN